MSRSDGPFGRCAARPGASRAPQGAPASASITDAPAVSGTTVLPLAGTSGRIVLHPQTKAMEFVGWLKSGSGLGHGHAMAVWEAFRRQGWISPAPTRAATGRAKAARRGPDLKEAAK